jgi:hypothetical protein
VSHQLSPDSEVDAHDVVRPCFVQRLVNRGDHTVVDRLALESQTRLDLHGRRLGGPHAGTEVDADRLDRERSPSSRNGVEDEQDDRDENDGDGEVEETAGRP